MSHLLENNSTNKPLLANQVFLGSPVLIDPSQITASVSFSTDVPGQLEFLHSQNGVDFFNFEDSFQYFGDSHNRQVSLKGLYIRIKYTNGPINQTSFLLFCRLLTSQNDDMNVNVDYRHDSILCYANEGGFDIRSLTAELDSVSIPAIEACITGVNNNTLNVFVTNQSGGSASNVQIFDSNGSSLLSDGDGKLQVSGTFDVGLTNYALENNGHLESVDMKLDIVQGLTFLNNKLLVDTGITGYSTNSKLDQVISAINDKHLNSTTDSVTVNVISGFATSALQTTANTKLDDIKTSIDNKHLDSTTDSVTVNLITGFATSALQTSTNTKLDTINTTITNKHLNSTTDSVGVTGSVNILNFPSVQDVLITNTEPISVTGLNIDIPSSITVNNFPVSFEVSNFPTSFEVSNFPTSFEISSLPSIDVSSIVPITITAMPHLNAEDDSVTVNLITGFATETKQDTQIEELEKVVDKKGDIEAVIYFFQGSTIWADTVPEPNQYERDPNGWAYENFEAGNAMNLYYFNGANETKTLNQVVGQYAVVSNLSTKLNNSLIFGIYTKGSPFFTTRITHSPASGVNLTAGGKFLCYWGSVPEDLYPSLPRLNFTDITTTGPAIPSEEILSISLNTNSSTPAGDIIIFVESLGVVFNNGSVDQSRVLKLLSDKTEYSLTVDNTQFNQLTYTYLSNLNKTNGGLDVYIQNSNIAISNTTFDIGNFPATQNTFITNDAFTPVPVSFSGGIDVNNTVNTLITNTSPISISGLVDINNYPAVQPVSFDGGITVNNFPAIQQVAFDGGITVNNFPLVQEVSFSAGITVNNFPTSTNSRTEDGSGNNITSTDLLSGKNGLDTASNIFGYAGSTRTALTCDSAGKMLVKNYTADGLGNEITSTTTSTSTNSLDTASSLYVSNGSTRSPLTATGSSLNTNITNTVPVSGTVAFSNTTIDIGNFPATQPVSGTVAISNSSIDSHIYGSSNGTDWHHILTTPQGRILNNSSTQDGNGTNITSTLVGSKQSLDVNVSNTTQSSVFTDIGNATGTDITATRIALDTASSLYVADGTTRTAITATGSSLNTNITNTVPVSGTVAVSGVSGTVAVSDTTSQGYLNTINQAVGYSYIESTPVGNATIAGNTIGTYATWTRGQYKRTVFNYSDGSTSNTDSISIYTKDNLGNGIMIATFYPYVVAGNRQYSGILDLSPFNTITVRNNSSSSISGVSLKIFST